MTGYVRQRDAQISSGSVIYAADIKAELDQVQTSHNSTAGHRHNGTTGEGAPITVVGPAQDLVVSTTSVLPKTTNTLSLGSTLVRFKEAFFNGVVTALTFVGNLTGNVTGNLTGNVTGNVTGAVTGNLTGNADTVTNGVYTVGSQTIGGVKTFANTILANGLKLSPTTDDVDLFTTATGLDIRNNVGNILSAKNNGSMTVGQPEIEVYTRKNVVGSVFESAGLPTGAVVQYDFIGGAHSIRWADGTQICWKNSIGTPQATTASGPLFTNASEEIFDFPLDFISLPTVMASTSGASARWATVSSISSSQAGIRVFCTVTSAANVPVNAIAIGRWF